MGTQECFPEAQASKAAFENTSNNGQLRGEKPWQ
jgi:hypothetical protein